MEKWSWHLLDVVSVCIMDGQADAKIRSYSGLVLVFGCILASKAMDGDGWPGAPLAGLSLVLHAQACQYVQYIQ